MAEQDERVKLTQEQVAVVQRHLKHRIYVDRKSNEIVAGPWQRKVQSQAEKDAKKAERKAERAKKTAKVNGLQSLARDKKAQIAKAAVAGKDVSKLQAELKSYQDEIAKIRAK